MRASGYDRVAADFFCEPQWVADALLDVEPLPGMSWDPNCGGGNTPQTMQARGLPCRGSDRSLTVTVCTTQTTSRRRSAT